MGQFSEFGLPDEEEPGIHALVPLEQLSNLSRDEQAQATQLFEKYQQTFAQENFDLGCANQVSQTIDTRGHHIIRLRPICRSTLA